MNCKEIIKDYLKAHGFDGLFNRMGECACKGEAPCDSGELPECEPAYWRDCETCELGRMGDCINEDFKDGGGCYSEKQKPLCRCDSPLVPAFIRIHEGSPLQPLLQSGTTKQFMKCPKCDQLYPPIEDSAVLKQATNASPKTCPSFDPGKVCELYRTNQDYYCGASPCTLTGTSSGVA